MNLINGLTASRTQHGEHSTFTAVYSVGEQGYSVGEQGTILLPKVIDVITRTKFGSMLQVPLPVQIFMTSKQQTQQ